MSLTPAALKLLHTPVLSDGVVTLRAYRSSDAPALFEAVRESIDHVGQWLAWCTDGYALSDSVAWILRNRDQWRTGTDAVFGVFDCADERLLGAVGVDHVDLLQRTGNIGYWTRRLALGRGVAPRAVRLATRYALTAMAAGAPGDLWWPAATGRVSGLRRNAALCSKAFCAIDCITEASRTMPGCTRWCARIYASGLHWDDHRFALASQYDFVCRF